MTGTHSVNPHWYVEIDALRAIAVSTVVAFHVAENVCPGGFVGVDVFFVVSGFVVSLAMSKTPHSGFLSYATAFYARRAARIVPALVFCLLVTMLLAVLLVPRGASGMSYARTGLGAFFGVSNLVLARAANGYFESASGFDPFTHTWSLGVEEQFYLLYPFVGWAMSRPDALTRKVALAVGVAATFFSLWICAAWTKSHSDWGFYLLPPRLWELALGVGLLSTRPRWEPLVASLPGVAARALAIAMLALIACSAAWADLHLFPWPWALMPTLATAVLIALIVGRADHALPSPMRSAPILALGRLSFSIYLWHWPVTVLMRWTTGLDTWPLRLTAVALALVFAVVSFRVVETPIRKSAGRISAGRAVAYGVLACTIGCMCAGGLAWAQPRMSLSTTADIALWLPQGGIEVPGSRPRCTVEVRAEDFLGGTHTRFIAQHCDREVVTSSGRLLVVGDSHAWAYTALLRLHAGFSGQPVELWTMGGCPVVAPRHVEGAPALSCRTFTDAVMAKLANESLAGDVLFLPALSIGRLATPWGPAEPPQSASDEQEAWSKATAEQLPYLQLLAARGVRIVLEAPKPVFAAPLFRCADPFNASNPICAPGFEIGRPEMERLRRIAMASQKELMDKLPGATRWDPLPVLCGAERCSAKDGGKPLFFDGDHLSGWGNLRLLTSFDSHLTALQLSRSPVSARP